MRKSIIITVASMAAVVVGLSFMTSSAKAVPVSEVQMVREAGEGNGPSEFGRGGRGGRGGHHGGHHGHHHGHHHHHHHHGRHHRGR